MVHLQQVQFIWREHFCQGSVDAISGRYIVKYTEKCRITVGVNRIGHC